MTITLGLNISSLKGQRQLARSSDALGKVFERLSSGQRINRAADDAAGLAIADSLKADSRVYTQGIRNLNDGLSILNVADGALQELSNITVRLKELASQSINGVYSNEQRLALNEEAQALAAEYSRITQSTEFNGRKLFSADYGELRLQAGYGLDASIGSGLGGAIATGEFEAGSTINSDLSGSFVLDSLGSADFNNDGNNDYILYDTGDLIIGLGQDGGGFADPYTVASATGSAFFELADIDDDGNIDIVHRTDAGEIATLFANGDGTFQSAVTSATTYGTTSGSLEMADINNDGNLDILSLDNGNNWEILLGSGDGTFTSVQTRNTTISANADFADINSDGNLDVIFGVTTAGGAIVYSLGNGDGTIDTTGVVVQTGTSSIYTRTSDVNNDGHMDIVSIDGANTIYTFYGNGDATFSMSSHTLSNGSISEFEIVDINSDGYDDYIVTEGISGTVNVLLSDGNGGFEEQIQSTAPTTAIVAMDINDFDHDGVYDFLGVAFGGGLSFMSGSTTDGVASLLEFSLASKYEAKLAQSQFTDKLNQLSAQRGQIGAFQSRVSAAESVLGATRDNYLTAESRIRDADIAAESANLVRLQILQQAAAAVLAQANIQPQLAIDLLRS